MEKTVDLDMSFNQTIDFSCMVEIEVDNQTMKNVF